MNGTEKQIAWAEKIRAKKLPILERKVAGEIEYLMNAGLSDYCRDSSIAQLNRNMEFIRANDSAVWWIENRDSLSLSRLKQENLK